MVRAKAAQQPPSRQAGAAARIPAAVFRRLNRTCRAHLGRCCASSTYGPSNDTRLTLPSLALKPMRARSASTSAHTGCFRTTSAVYLPPSAHRPSARKQTPLARTRGAASATAPARPAAGSARGRLRSGVSCAAEIAATLLSRPTNHPGTASFSRPCAPSAAPGRPSLRAAERDENHNRAMHPPPTQEVRKSCRSGRIGAAILVPPQRVFQPFRGSAKSFHLRAQVAAPRSATRLSDPRRSSAMSGLQVAPGAVVCGVGRCHRGAAQLALSMPQARLLHCRQRDDWRGYSRASDSAHRRRGESLRHVLAPSRDRTVQSSLARTTSSRSACKSSTSAQRVPFAAAHAAQGLARPDADDRRRQHLRGRLGCVARRAAAA